ncbi:MAG: hypothetical protein DMF68_07230 [Acidobacteria bacterium]|nr:MAG: hypothetical protein DMF68_07230 [Acidobacteriota bacterium]
MCKITTPSKLFLASALLFALICVASSVCAQQATFTITGRVTDQSTGQPISGVAIAGVGNQTGAKVAITDAQGNYTLPFGANTDIKLRAYKTNYLINPVSAEISSPGGFSLFGTFTTNFTGSSFPFPILVFAQPPILLTEDSSLNALALDSVEQTRDPFAITNDGYFGTDKRTRLQLYLVDMDLYSGETLSIITVQAVDSQQKTYNLVVEDLRKVTDTPWLSQLTVRLPSELGGVTNITVTVSARGQTSNAAKLRLK